MLLAPEANFGASLDVGVPFFECGAGFVGPRDESGDAALGSGSLALTLLWHCRKAGHVSSPLHLFFLSALASAHSSASGLGLSGVCTGYCIKFCDFFGLVLFASSFAHPQTSHPPPRSLGRAGVLAMACWFVTRDATTSLRDGGPPNKRTQRLDLAHHCFIGSKG